MKTTIAIAIAIASITHANFTANAVGLVNGSFETPDLSIPGQPYVLGYVPTPSFGWTVASGNIDLMGSNWQASDGQQSIDMNGFSAGSIYQDFTFPTSGLYTIKFDLSANPDTIISGFKPVRLDFGPASGTLSSLGTYSLSDVGRTHANMLYVEYTTAVLAVTDSTTYRIQFTSLIAGNGGAVLDNVRIVAVPEPTLLSLLGVGCFLGRILKRKTCEY